MSGKDKTKEKKHRKDKHKKRNRDRSHDKEYSGLERESIRVRIVQQPKLFETIWKFTFFPICNLG